MKITIQNHTLIFKLLELSSEGGVERTVEELVNLILEEALLPAQLRTAPPLEPVKRAKFRFP